MEVKGKLKAILPLESGISKAEKEWKKQSIVIDTGEDFNNIVCVSAFGDKVKQLSALKLGDKMTILCNVYSREYKGKYYHNIDGYHFTVNSKEELSNDSMVTSDDNQDLPF
jgi:hypothetical protein